MESAESNFPRVFKVWFIENGKELARRCVEPPKKPKLNAPPFEPKPSLEQMVGFLVTRLVYVRQNDVSEGITKLAHIVEFSKFFNHDFFKNKTQIEILDDENKIRPYQSFSMSEKRTVM